MRTCVTCSRGCQRTRPAPSGNCCRIVGWRPRKPASQEYQDGFAARLPSGCQPIRQAASATYFHTAGRHRPEGLRRRLAHGAGDFAGRIRCAHILAGLVEHQESGAPCTSNRERYDSRSSRAIEGQFRGKPWLPEPIGSEKASRQSVAPYGGRQMEKTAKQSFPGQKQSQLLRSSTSGASQCHQSVRLLPAASHRLQVQELVLRRS